jgi:hypothetical protein
MGFTGSWIAELGVAALGTTVAANLANAVVSGSVADLVGHR